MSEPVHVPVLLDEVLEYLQIHSDMWVFDGTVGAGGHAGPILERIAPGGHLVGSDRDPEILKLAETSLARFGGRVSLYQARISSAAEVLRKEGNPPLDAFLIDLGVSSLQLDRPERGFSFQQDGPLDMRMNPAEGESAADLVNRLGETELANLIYQLGEERHSRRIAKAIVQRRRKAPFLRTLDLAQLVERTIGRREKIHPATRVFQALRIAVNQELDELRQGLASLLPLLAPGGRGAVISFHSLEDRIVKDLFFEAEKQGGYRRVTRKPVVPTDRESSLNRRSRGAKMRVLERTTKEA